MILAQKAKLLANPIEVMAPAKPPNGMVENWNKSWD
jgi:hypothetical protein